MKKFSEKNKYFCWGMTSFVVIAACILLYISITNWSVFTAGVKKVSMILSPFIWGFVIAYLLRPLVNYFEAKLTRRLGGGIFPKNERRAFILGRSISILISETLMLMLVTLLIWMVMPQLYASIESIVTNTPLYYEKVVSWAGKFLTDYPKLEDAFVNLVGDLSESLVQWTSTSLLPQMTNLLTNISSGVYYLLRGVYYIVIGIIVSIYILFNKESVSIGAKKAVYAVFQIPFAKKFLDGVRFSDGIFMGFITGKIVDSIIIGFICYICCTILAIPYTTLISVIVGVTNIIPFFGPFIGAIPSAIIILMISPIKCLEFVIFILLLQQFDGNILGPKILGESIGVNGFWVMFSIILGGGLFGFSGMLLGVPVFVIVYTGIRNLADRRLKNSGLPTEPAFYENLHHIDPDGKEAVINPPKGEKMSARAKKQPREKHEDKE